MINSQKLPSWDSPCGPAIKTPPANAPRFEPCSGKIPHAAEQLSSNYWSVGAWGLCPATRDATAIRSSCAAMKKSLRTPQLEKAHTQQQRPSEAKKWISFKNAFLKRSIKRKNKETAKLSSRVAVPFCTHSHYQQRDFHCSHLHQFLAQSGFLFLLVYNFNHSGECVVFTTLFFKFTNVSKTSCCTSLIYTICCQLYLNKAGRSL